MHLIASVGAVGEQLPLTSYGSESLQQPTPSGPIAPLARGQGHGQRQPILQHERVQLGRQASARATDRPVPPLLGALIAS